MKLTVVQTIQTVNEIIRRENEVEIMPFDIGVGAVPTSVVDAKGDLIVGTGDNTVTRLPVGQNLYVLSADSAEISGLKWIAQSGGSTMNLYNNSGNSVAQGDVVVFDPSYDSAFKTTTAPSDRRVIGVAIETINATVVGKIACSGLVVVNCDTGAVARGQFLCASATVKLAKGSGYFKSDADFAIAVSAKGAGSNGQVYAVLFDNWQQGIGGTIGYASGGYTTTVVADTHKCILASGVWSTISGGAQPVARCNSGSIVSATAMYSECGSTSTSTNSVAPSYKMPWATEVFSNNANVTRQLSRQSTGANGVSHSYIAGGSNNTPTIQRYVDKVVHSTDVVSVSTDMINTAEYTRAFSDGTYTYIKGVLGTKVEKITFASDVTSASTQTSASTNVSNNPMSFPSVAGYESCTVSQSYKISFATGLFSVLSSTPPGDNATGASAVTDGVAIGFVSFGNMTTQAKFTLATELYSADSNSSPTIAMRVISGNNYAY